MQLTRFNLRAAITALALVGFAACATHSAPAAEVDPAPSTAAPRYGSTVGLVIAGDADVRPLSGPRSPVYPEEARRRNREATVHAAFILDTTGSVEPRSITILPPLASPEFQSSVCTFLVQTRFAPVARDGVRRRALVIHPFSFALVREGAAPGLQDPPNLDREAARARGLDSTLATFEHYPHCRG